MEARAPARRRRRIPWAVRTTALAGLALTVAYVALYLAVRTFDPERAAAMLRMYGLTIAAGRETAMLDALNRGLPPLWVYGLSVIDDLGSLLLALPFAWLVVRSLKRFHALRWTIARLEKQALLHRRWLQRWGLGGLAMLYFLPGFGAGVPMTVLLGVLARIPFGTLVAFFGVAVPIVDGLWTLALTGVVRILPDAPWLDYVPLTVISLAVVSAAVGLWRGRAERHVALLDWPVAPSREAGERLRAAGIRSQDGLVRADLDAVAERLGGQERRKGRLLAAAELLLLEGMAEGDALALVRAGVHGLEDLAAADPDALRRRASAAGVEWGSRGDAWTAQAQDLVDARHVSWPRRHEAAAF